MHILQPKHIKLKQEETEKLISEYNISLVQLPKIRVTDPALPDGVKIGDVVKIERLDESGKVVVYYRVVGV